MGKTLQDVMSTTPITLPATATVEQAAMRMRDDDIGDVIVMDGGQVCSIVTDRDIVVRAMAERRDPASTPIRDICSRDLVTMEPGDEVKKAIEVMKDRAIRRIPVCQDGNPVGIVSIGDLAIESHGEKALAGISAAAPNN